MIDGNDMSNGIIERISEDNYLPFYNLVRRNQWGNILLPNKYVSSLWGGLIHKGDAIVGGWIGIVRGNKPIIKCIAKSVYFDAYPIFASQEYADRYQQKLIDTMREWARKEHIVMFNLTHWVRGVGLPYLHTEHNATFLLPLQDTTDLQWKMIESTQRNKIRKGERNGVDVIALNGDEAIAQLQVFQQLRAQTQQHAIGKNASTSMLLKSDIFFKNILQKTNATLFIGSAQTKPATVALMIASGETVYYYSGGSDYELNRQTGSSAYVIWKAIEYYREQHSIRFMDMGGVPPTPATDHPAYGVYVFKRSFGGEYIEFDAGVIVINKIKYAILKQVLSMRKILRVFSKYL